MLGYSSKINNPIPNLIEVIVVIVVFKWRNTKQWKAYIKLFEKNVLKENGW